MRPALYPGMSISRRAFYFSLIIAPFFMFVLFTYAIEAHAEETKSNLLLISSYHPNFPSFYQQIEGIRSVLPISKSNLDVEFMDSKRFPDKAQRDRFLAYFTEKRTRLPKYDIIFISDDNAFNFMLANKNALFPDIPVVFLGVNNLNKAIAQDENASVTGVVEASSMTETLELAQQLIPNLKNVYAIADSTKTSQSILLEFQSKQKGFPALKFHSFDLSTLSWAELAEKLGTLRPESCILPLAAYVDKTDEWKHFTESFALIDQHVKAPVFHLWEHALGDGIIGGVLVSHFQQGLQAALIAKQILDGENVANIKVQRTSPNRTVLDYKILNQFGITRSQVPKGVELINPPKSIYSEYRELVLFALITFVVLCGLILILLINIGKLRSAENRLRESERFFKVLFTRSTQFCVLLDRYGRVLRANKTSLNFIDTQDLEVSNKLFWETPWWKDSGYTESVQNAIKLAVAGQETHFLARNLKVKTGNIHLDVSIKPIMGPKAVEFLLAEGRDVSKLCDIEDKLRHTEKLDAIGQLAGGVAHDFNNQLSGIMGYSEMLAFDLESDKHKKYLKHIITSAKRAAELTKQLLTFARRSKQENKPTEMHEIIHEAVNILERSIDKRITIDLQLKAEDSVISGDASQLQNAILNLAVNARDAMPEGGEIMITTANVGMGSHDLTNHPHLKSPGRYFELRVIDTGCGMPKEVRKRIFEPFFTTKETGKGTGMGLAAVYGAIKHHKGMITVYTEPSKGTSFVILLPVSKETEAKTPLRELDLSILDGKRILLIEDEPVLRDMCKDLLGALGCDAHAEENGLHGLAYYRKHWKKIDVVILDMIMPGMGGRETFPELRKINPDVIVLIASGFSAEGDASTLLRQGAAGFIQKPFQQRELTEKLTDTILSSQRN